MLRPGIKAALLIAGFGLSLLAVLDLTAAMRPSGLSALACVPGLVARGPAADAVVERHRAVIIREAARNDLPPELLGVVITDHQRNLSRFRRFTDCAGSALGANLSLGPAQVRLGTAAQLDGAAIDRLPAPDFRSLRAVLLEPESNIAYAARELRALLEQNNRFPGLTAAELIHEPFSMGLILTEYRVGRRHTANDSTRVGVSALNALRLLQDGMLDRFGREPLDAERAAAEVHDYLQQGYCEHAPFNNRRCVPWTPSPAGPGPDSPGSP